MHIGLWAQPWLGKHSRNSEANRHLGVDRDADVTDWMPICRRCRNLERNLALNKLYTGICPAGKASGGAGDWTCGCSPTFLSVGRVLGKGCYAVFACLPSDLLSQKQGLNSYSWNKEPYGYVASDQQDLVDVDGHGTTMHYLRVRRRIDHRPWGLDRDRNKLLPSRAGPEVRSFSRGANKAAPCAMPL